MFFMRVFCTIFLGYDFLVQKLIFARDVYPVYATMPTAAKIPMIATTTKSSISENPLFTEIKYTKKNIYFKKVVSKCSRSVPYEKK